MSIKIATEPQKKVASQSRLGCHCMSVKPLLCLLKERRTRSKSTRCTQHLAHNLHLDNHHGFRTKAHQALHRPVCHDLGLWTLLSKSSSSSPSSQQCHRCRCSGSCRKMARIRGTTRRRLSISMPDAQCDVCFCFSSAPLMV